MTDAVPEQRKPYVPLNPLDVENKLRCCIRDLGEAEQMLAEARDNETAADIEYQRAWRKAMLSPDCPVPNRSDVTVAFRDAWVQERCAPEWEALRFAQVATKSAEDHMRTVREVTSATQTIASGMRSAMSLAGYSGGA